MAYSKIRGNSQIKDLTISGAQIAAGTVSTDKLTDGAKILLSDGTVSLADDLNLGNNQIKNVGAPVDDNDAVRKTDLDAVSSGTSVFRELPSGTINGTNTSFSLNNEPNIGTEQVFLNGSLLNVGANSDYVIADDTITFTVAPIAGDVILVNYITNAVLLSVEISSVVSAINSRLTTAEGELFTAQGDITSLDSDLTGIDSRLTTAEADIVTVEGDIASIESSITSVQSDIASVESDIAAEESARISAVDALDSSVSSIQTSVTSLGNRMTAAEGDIGDLEAADATMDTRVGAIEDGLQSETTSRTNADTSLSSRVTTLEGAPAPATSLSALTDVSVSSPTADQILKYNGTNWVNGAAPSTFSGSYTDLTNKPTIPTNLDSLTDVAITSAVKGHFIVHDGTGFVNSRTIEASSGAVVPLTVKGASGQSQNYFSVVGTGNVAVVNVDNNGRLNAYWAMTTIAGTSGAIPLIAKGAASQSASLFEAQNSGGTALFRLTSAGVVTQAVNGNTLGALTVTTTAAATKALVVKGAASQTANLLEIQNNAGTALWSIDSTGSLASGTVPVARVSGLATVATSGSYTDLINTPTIPSVVGLASETYVDTAVAGVVNSAPAVLNTLNELALALGSDPDFATTIAGQIGAKADTSSLATVATSGSYVDLTNKPTIALAAHQWSANHTIADGTRYLIGDIVYDNGNIFVANYENESMPTSSELYWTNLGAGKRINIDGRDIQNIPYSSLTGKPSLFDGAYASLTGKPTIYTPVKEVPSGNINGTNVTFVISDSPAVAGTEQVFLNGLLQFAGAGDDYTISGDTITFNTAPETGWKLVVCYSV